MRKTEFIDAIIEKSGVSRKDVYAVYDAMVSEIADKLSAKEQIVLTGFGTFKVGHREQRNGRNPVTGESIVIPEKYVPKFSFSKNMKDSIK